MPHTAQNKSSDLYVLISLLRWRLYETLHHLRNQVHTVPRRAIHFTVLILIRDKLPNAIELPIGSFLIAHTSRYQPRRKFQSDNKEHRLTSMGEQRWPKLTKINKPSLWIGEIYNFSSRLVVFFTTAPARSLSLHCPTHYWITSCVFSYYWFVESEAGCYSRAVGFGFIQSIRQRMLKFDV